MPSATPQSQRMPDLSGLRIDDGRIELLHIIGSGTYGVVYCASDLDAHPAAPRFFAVKCQSRVVEHRQRLYQRREVALHTLASPHPNVVTLHRVLHEGQFIFLVLDFCPDGDLFGMLTERNCFVNNDALIKDTFIQLLDAVEFIHSIGVYHRDLKPENVLCTRKGARLLLTDFGLATSEKESMDFECGSSYYMSPECIGEVFGRFGKFSHLESDIWALGVILVNITCARNPWRTASLADDAFRAYLHDPNYLRRTLPISKDTNDLLKRVFTLNPNARLSIAEFRKAIRRIPRFTLTAAELAKASPVVRAAAQAVQVAPQRRKRVPVCSIRSADITSPTAPIQQPSDQVLATAPADPHRDIADEQPWADDLLGLDEEFDCLDLDSDDASLCSVASSVGPTTPEMPATDPGAAVADLDDDVLDIVGDEEQGTSTGAYTTAVARYARIPASKHASSTDVPKKDPAPRRFLKTALRKMKALGS